MALNGVMIKINDIFDDLRHENNRLFNELLFANNYINALNAFKDHLFAIYCKCETIATEEDKQLITALSDQLKTIIDDNQKKASLDGTDVQQTSQSNGHKKAIRKTPEEDNEDSDETYVDNNRKRLTKKRTATKTAIAAKKPKSKTIKTKVETKNELKNNKTVNCLTEETTATSAATADGQQSLTTTSLVTSDGRTMFVCQHVGCGQTYDRVSHLRRHRVTHVTERPYRCNLDADCDAVFDYKYLLRQHVVRVHTADPEASDGQRLRQRLENQRCFDPITEAYHCPHSPCDKTFSDLSALTRHLRLRHPARQFPCDYEGCDKLYNTAALLKRHHMAAHAVVKRFGCQHPGCTYQTAYRSGLRIHEDTHRTTDRPLYRCTAAADCERAFKTALSLRYHVQKVHTPEEERRYFCTHPDCGRTFPGGAQLRLHRAIHCAEPTLRCTQEGCQEMFGSEWNLKKHVAIVHKRRASVQKPKPKYACEWPGCDYKNSLAVLRHHRYLHTGDRPYVCDWPECGKRFRLAVGLKDHKNIHNNVRPYACHWPGCQYACTHSANLFKHMRLMHQNK